MVASRWYLYSNRGPAGRFVDEMRRAVNVQDRMRDQVLLMRIRCSRQD